MIESGWDATMHAADGSVVSISGTEGGSEGLAFLIEERRPKESLEMCERFAAEGAEVMIISRDPPMRLLERCVFVPKRTIWLTSLVGKNRLEPTAIGILMTEIKKFTEESKKRSVVLIDGLEYLISVNTYDRMLQFIHQIRDIFVTAGGVLVMPIDVRTLTDRERALLERNLQTIVAQQPSENMDAGEHMFHLSSGEGIGT